MELPNALEQRTLIILHEGILVLVIFTFAKFLQRHPVCPDLEILKSNKSALSLLGNDRMHKILMSKLL
jgi:hypothetical protein